jgi:hypothetical protein
MKYPEYDNVQGKHGGPYHTEITVLEREKRSAAVEEREPDYQRVLDDLYSGNLPTSDDDPLRIDHDDIVYDDPNSSAKQQKKVEAIEEEKMKEQGADYGRDPYGNVGNQDLDVAGIPSAEEEKARQESVKAQQDKAEELQNQSTPGYQVPLVSEEQRAAESKEDNSLTPSPADSDVQLPDENEKKDDDVVVEDNKRDDILGI